MTRTEPTMPADTSMMRIVHTAVRRDLDRATQALTAAEPPGDRQRTAIARHLAWMMGFLEAHHRSEDEGLYPVVRERRPDAGPLLDAMDRDHREIAVAIDRVRQTSRQYGDARDDAARDALVVAIDELRHPLYGHLRREEDEVMPIVSGCMTHAEWSAIEQEHNVGPKSMKELGFEGHWLIDGADETDRRTVLGLVPAVPRFVLLHGFGPRYRRRRDACWNPARRRRHVQPRGAVAVEVDTPVDAVWEVVQDPTRVGEWSHECIAAEYLGGSGRAAPGVRFRGRNRQGVFRWGRTCEVLSIEPYELVWRTVPTTFTPDSSIWRIRLSPTATGTRIEQSFEVVRVAPVLDVVYATILPAHRDRDAALEADLRRLGALAARAVVHRAPATPTDAAG